MTDRLCRWGILGTATIAQKNWKAIWNAENATLAAVASRNAERAGAFIAECQPQAAFDPPPRACGSYEELIGRDDVDAVYIPLPTGIRKQWVIRAAEAGKHVLAEKPVGVNAADVAEMVDACRQNNVQLMDGVMFMHSARLEHVKQVLDDGESVGPIRRIVTHHAFCGPDDFLRNNIRLNSDLEPHGAMGDLGWYNIRFILWAMDWQLPERICGRMLNELQRADSPAPVPLEMSVEMFYPDGVSASFYCSFITENQQWVNVGGPKGFLYLPDLVLPFSGSELNFTVRNAFYNVTGCDFHMEPRQRRFSVLEYANSAANAQETNMIHNFSASVLSGRPDPHWGQIALLTQKVMDACLASARADGAITKIND